MYRYEQEREPSCPPVADRVMGIDWREVRVDDGTVAYASVGHGSPVVFLHGWGLTHRTYDRALLSLAQNGVQVCAPALPGFGGTSELPADERNFAGYARWLGRFLEAIGIDEPVTLVGHSFGGGIAIQTAHDLSPDRVSRIVLVNSVGGGAWSPDGRGARPIVERPLWDWGAAAAGEVLSIRSFASVAARIADNAVTSMLRNPGAVWRAAHLARTADLTRELDQLAARGLPVMLLWGRGDRVIPHASFESLHAALGKPPVFSVPGAHGWLINDPACFGDAMKAVLDEWPPGVVA